MQSIYSSSFFDAFGHLIAECFATTSKLELHQVVAEFLPTFITDSRVSLALMASDQKRIEILSRENIRSEQLFATLDPFDDQLLISKVMRRQEALIERPTFESPYLDVRHWAQEGLVSMVIVPLIVQNQVIGTFNVGNLASPDKGVINLGVLSQIATLISVNLERLRLFNQNQETLDRHQQYAERLEILNEMGRCLASAVTEEEVFHIVAEAIEHVLEADRVSYVIPNIDQVSCQIFALKGNDIIPKAHQYPLEGSGIAAVLQAAIPMAFPDLGDSTYCEHEMLFSQGLRMGWSVPIFVFKELVGILNAATSTQWPFPDDALTLLSALGRFMGTTIERIQAQQNVVTTLEQLEHQVFHDMLTGLPNRKWLEKTLAEEIEHQRSQQGRLVIFFIDLDGFKRVNDSLSHSIGDQLLCAVAQRLQENLSSKDAVTRMGGDEFVVFLRDISSPEQSLEIAKRLLEALKQPFIVAEHHIQIGGSLGVSCFPEHGQSVDELMKYADIAMYAAKANGRNSYQIYSVKMSEKLRLRFELERDLRQAIAQDDLSLMFQPQVEVASGEVIAIEALVRWIHPHQGNISPAVFIPIAEEAGLIGDITAWVLNHALYVLAALRSNHPNIYISINIAAWDLVKPEILTDLIESTLKKYNLPGDSLELELTESVFLEHAQTAIDVIQNWKQQGIRLAIDDFGTGFSSLSYLLNLPMDTLKIDRTFVQSIHTDEKKKGIVKTILALGDSLNLTCIAEGVEEQEQLSCLTQLGCQKIQGFLFAKPMLFQKLERFLKQQSSKVANCSSLSVDLISSKF